MMGLSRTEVVGWLFSLFLLFSFFSLFLLFPFFFFFFELSFLGREEFLMIHLSIISKPERNLSFSVLFYFLKKKI